MILYGSNKWFKVNKTRTFTNNNTIFKKMYYSDSFVKYIIGVKEIKHNTCKYNNLTKQVCDWINDVT